MPHQAWEIDGRPVPSVTEVIGLYTHPALLYWYGKNGTAECTRLKEAAAETGREVHARIEECFLRRAHLTGDDLPSILADKAWTWAEENGVEVVAQEEPLLSKEDRYGGTEDLIHRFKGDQRLWVCDWKTSSQISETYRLQLAAYAKAYNEIHGLTWATGINQGVILRLDKKDASKLPQEKRFENLERDYAAFLGLRTFWDFLKGEGPWRDDVAKPRAKSRRRKSS